MKEKERGEGKVKERRVDKRGKTVKRRRGREEGR